ncbi:hypothetical protein BX666DRAFT_1017385 [Dichotomocladium elegans]|nr:hypothetical protein BX666DRAFT_1017385 [Dichotomocladium elegans]
MSFAAVWLLIFIIPQNRMPPDPKGSTPLNCCCAKEYINSGRPIYVIAIGDMRLFWEKCKHGADSHDDDHWTQDEHQ